jgi:hypothetical protein
MPKSISFRWPFTNTKLAGFRSPVETWCRVHGQVKVETTQCMMSQVAIATPLVAIAIVIATHGALKAGAARSRRQTRPRTPSPGICAARHSTQNNNLRHRPNTMALCVCHAHYFNTHTAPLLTAPIIAGGNNSRRSTFATHSFDLNPPTAVITQKVVRTVHDAIDVRAFRPHNAANAQLELTK